MSSLLSGLLDPSALWMPALVAAAAVGGLLAERALVAWGQPTYFRLVLPLGQALVPIPAPPRGDGRTASVRYAVDEPRGWVRFWAQPGDRTAPLGLHGVVLLTPTTRGVALEVRWAPPWTVAAALLWFAGLGVARGQGLVTVPVALGLLGIGFVLYRDAAARAARELRWAFVRGDGDGDEGGEGA